MIPIAAQPAGVELIAADAKGLALACLLFWFASETRLDDANLMFAKPKTQAFALYVHQLPEAVSVN